MTTLDAAEEALHRFVRAVIAQDIPTLLSTILPEAMMAIMGLGLQSAGPLQSYEVVGRTQEDDLTVFTVRFVADETFFLRLEWKDVAGTWKVAGAARATAAAGASPAPFAPALPPLDLSWLAAKTEWGVHARVGPRGLTLEAINVGSYGEVPERSSHTTQRPRGAEPAVGVSSMGYTVLDKWEVWSPLAACLYEEAIQRRWRPANDIPWDTLAPLPDDVEAAMCQVCTALCERAAVANDAPAAWESRISYDFLEVKLYLATQIFDAARHIEVFRKRALANGGGLGVQTPGQAIRAVLEATSFTEMSLALHLLLTTHTLGIVRALHAVAHNRAEQLIARYCLQDLARWLAYGVTHLRYLLEQQPGRAAELHKYLDKIEGMVAYDDAKDVPLGEAMAVLLGGGTAGVRAGAARWRRHKGRIVEEYLRRLAAGGLPDRRSRIEPRLAAMLT
jgi:hypothetical protein